MPTCIKCQSEMVFKQGVSKKVNPKTGELYGPWAGHFCSNKECGAVDWQRQQRKPADSQGQPINPQGGGGYVTFEHFNKTMNEMGERVAKLERNVLGEGGGPVDPDGTISKDEVTYAKEQNTNFYNNPPLTEEDKRAIAEGDGKNYNGVENPEQ